jgi:hypothetical protein
MSILFLLHIKPMHTLAVSSSFFLSYEVEASSLYWLVPPATLSLEIWGSAVIVSVADGAIVGCDGLMERQKRKLTYLAMGLYFYLCMSCPPSSISRGTRVATQFQERMAKSCRAIDNH